MVSAFVARPGDLLLDRGGGCKVVASAEDVECLEVADLSGNVDSGDIGWSGGDECSEDVEPQCRLS